MLLYCISTLFPSHPQQPFVSKDILNVALSFRGAFSTALVPQEGQLSRGRGCKAPLHFRWAILFMIPGQKLQPSSDSHEAPG